MEKKEFTDFPVLKTERLTLRQLSDNDKQSIFLLRSDKEVNKYLDREPAKTIEDAIHFIEKINDNFKNGNSIYWVICLTETNTVVGTVCIFDFSTEKNSCEIGYELLTEFRGRGIMAEAVEKVVNYVLTALKFKTILAFTDVQNRGSTRLLVKLNFVKWPEKDQENPALDRFIFSQ